MKSKVLLTAASAFITLSLCSCSSMTEDIGQATELLNQQKYQEAISLLGDFHSSKSKKLLSEAYTDYGIAALRDKSIGKTERYRLAQERFKKAFETNAKNTKAKDLYEMLNKLQALNSMSK